MAASAGPFPAIERFFQFSLLGMLASGYLAVAGTGVLDWPTVAATLLALALRAAMVAGLVEFDLSNRMVAVLTLLYIGFYPIDYQYVSGSFGAATVHLVFFLVCIKVVTAKNNRDYTYLRILATLELLAAALFSVTLGFFAFLALFLLCGIASLASSEVRRSAGLRTNVARGARRAFPMRLALLSLALFFGIITMTAGMFFLLPRTARAALGRFGPARYHLPGFSNEITLGQIGEIQQSGRTVMHARTYGGESLEGVRWRGAALSQFDGKRWFNPPSREEVRTVERNIITLARVRHDRRGRGFAYQVELNDIAPDTLFFAGAPETISIGVPYLRFGHGGAIRLPIWSRTGIWYSAYSFFAEESAPVTTRANQLTLTEREEMLRLPALDPSIARLASDWTAGALTDQGKAVMVQQELRRNYGYTLELLDHEVADPLANFLFVRKKGHCEYFASAMAVLLRTQRIPSRVVTGFESGVYNPMTGWQVIRASDAHSWIEAWIDGRGWTTFDPTPPAAATSPGLFSRLSLFVDAADQFWQDWVLSYDLERQVVLASRVGESGRKLGFNWLPDLGALMKRVVGVGWLVPAMAGMVTGALALILWFGPALERWWRAHLGVRRARRGEGQSSDATLLYQRMLTLLERRGFQKPPWLTPVEFARGLPTSDLAILVEDLTAAYNEFRFGGRRDVAPRMVRLLSQLEKRASAVTVP